MSGASKKMINKEKLERLSDLVLKKEAEFLRQKRTLDIDKVKDLKQEIYKEVLGMKNYGGRK